MLIDSAGTIISSENRELLQTKATPEILRLLEGTEQSTASGDMLVLSSATKNGDYLAVYMMRYYRIYKEALNLALLLLVIGIFVIIIAVFLSSMLAQSIVRPVIQLADYADEAGKGHFDLPVPVHSRDEIGFLAERFGVMNHNIKELTTCIYNEQTQKKNTN